MFLQNWFGRIEIETFGRKVGELKCVKREEGEGGGGEEEADQGGRERRTLERKQKGKSAC